MAFAYERPQAEVWVPDGSDLAAALERTTDLGVVAHQDDLEFMALAPIAACLGDADRWFTGVACTDGAGSARAGRYASITDDEMMAIRRAEQREAAEIGGYSAIFQLGHPSASIRGDEQAAIDGRPTLVAELAEILGAARPVNLWTHNLADKHTTHLAAALAAIEGVRRMPSDERPHRVIGIEGWRSLDWLPDDEKILLDVSGHRELADRLSAVFASQIDGGKRYDRAERGRRQANATLLEPRAVDDADEITFAMDLTPLARNDDLDPADFVAAAVARLQDDVVTAIRTLRR